VYKLSERDGGELHQVYRRLPEKPVFPKATFQYVDLRSVVNRGWRNGARKGVEAWTGEGDNDMRNIPLGKQTFGIIKFDVIDPRKNKGRSVLRISPDGKNGPAMVTIPVGNRTARSLFFLQTTAHSIPRFAVAGVYDIMYADGTVEQMFVRNSKEIGPWWGISGNADQRRGQDAVDLSMTRVAWQGANATWANVGMYMNGWNNPHPDKEIAAIRVSAAKNPGRIGGIMLAGISLSSRRVQYDESIRSYGLPDCWAQAAVYYAVAEGLAGIEDKGRAFHKVSRTRDARSTK
jgi:hypothetical protein